MSAIVITSAGLLAGAAVAGIVYALGSGATTAVSEIAAAAAEGAAAAAAGIARVLSAPVAAPAALTAAGRAAASFVRSTIGAGGAASARTSAMVAGGATAVIVSAAATAATAGSRAALRAAAAAVDFVRDASSRQRGGAGAAAEAEGALAFGGGLDDLIMRDAELVESSQCGIDAVLPRLPSPTPRGPPPPAATPRMIPLVDGSEPFSSPWLVLPQQRRVVGGARYGGADGAWEVTV
jgi:hypothetical protein